MSLAARVIARTKQAGLIAKVVGRFKAAAYDGKFVGKDARLQWSRQTWLLEELPQKGKKKLRSADLQNPSGIGGRYDWWLPDNILMLAKLSTSDDFDKIKSKIMDAYKEAYKRAEESKDQRVQEEMKHGEWIKDLKWYENTVFYLNVIPEGVGPFTVEGKDFTMKVQWDKFSAYSPNSDFQQSDPHYTVYEQSSPTAARKLYVLLKTDPNQLKGISWVNLSSWFNKNKVQYKTHHSVWH